MPACDGEPPWRPEPPLWPWLEATACLSMLSSFLYYIDNDSEKQKNILAFFMWHFFFLQLFSSIERNSGWVGQEGGRCYAWAGTEAPVTKIVRPNIKHAFLSVWSLISIF